MINDLGLKSTCAARERQQQVIIRKLREKYKVITAERLSRCFLDEKLPEEEMIRLRARSAADDHMYLVSAARRKKQISMLRIAEVRGRGRKRQRMTATARESDSPMNQRAAAQEALGRDRSADAEGYGDASPSCKAILPAT